MKPNTRNDIQNDKIAAIGIGAMIVFIALILVAAVAAAVIIQTAEKLQQNAQTTGDDTADNMAGKILIQQAFVAGGGTGGAPAAMTPGEAYQFFVRLAPGSDPAPVNQITFQLFCANGVREGTVGDPDGGGALTADGAVSLMDTATEPPTLLNSNTGIMQPSTGYVLWIDANGGNAATPGLQDCSPDSGDSTVEFYVHVGNGGTTYETLTINKQAAGSAVI